MVVLVAAVLALLGSAAAAFAYQSHRSDTTVAVSPGWGSGMMDGDMMGGYDEGADNGNATVDSDQAQSLAQAWVDKNAAGATLDGPVAMPMGYLFTLTRDDAIVAQIVVNSRSGAITVRTWPTPSATATG
ncbi:MAG: hypothetical protein GC157_17770 [Frankiales bacterium]|nr:hypothetical protein [Frankiales bacterium]